MLRTATFNEIFMEEPAGAERVRVHTPHASTTLQLGAPEAPEDGVRRRGPRRGGR